MKMDGSLINDPSIFIVALSFKHPPYQEIHITGVKFVKYTNLNIDFVRIPNRPVIPQSELNTIWLCRITESFLQTPTLPQIFVEPVQCTGDIFVSKLGMTGPGK